MFLAAAKCLECGGQGRNRTADASLFRAALFRSHLVDSVALAPLSSIKTASIIGMVMEWFLEWPTLLTHPLPAAATLEQTAGRYPRLCWPSNGASVLVHP